MADPKIADSPIRTIQLSALVVMRIIKHSTTTFPTPATGCLVGMDINTELQITNSFPFPASNPENQQQASASNPADPYHQADQAALALAAPRAKSSATYAGEMIKFLREVNVDAQGVGWYMSCSMGNFVSQAFVENQAFYQRGSEERTVALVFDTARTSAGSLNLKAYRLSPSFMAAYKEGKFTSERYAMPYPNNKKDAVRKSTVLTTMATASKRATSAIKTSSSNSPLQSKTPTSSPPTSTIYLPLLLRKRPP